MTCWNDQTTFKPFLPRLAMLGALMLMWVGSLPAQVPEDGFRLSHDGNVRGLAQLPDGRIMVAGGFSYIGGQARGRLVRIHPDGRIDDSFNHPGISQAVRSVATQPDGKVLIGGAFLVGEHGHPDSRWMVARLNSDGSVDTSFDVGTLILPTGGTGRLQIPGSSAAKLTERLGG